MDAPVERASEGSVTGCFVEPVKSSPMRRTISALARDAMGDWGTGDATNQAKSEREWTDDTGIGWLAGQLYKILQSSGTSVVSGRPRHCAFGGNMGEGVHFTLRLTVN